MGKTTDKRHVDNSRTVIKINRLLQHKSQKQVSEGLCTASHLSKIEQGEAHPSEQLRMQLYHRLDLTCEQADDFLVAGYNDIVAFFKSFMFNEFDITNKHFHNLEDNESSFMASPFVLDYIIAKMSFCSVQNRKAYSDIKALLSTMTDHMSRDQKYHYYLCLGIDALKISKDIKRAEQYFKRAQKYACTGQLHYWFSYMYLTKRQPIAAIREIEKSLASYFEEVNSVGIISAFELMGLIYYATSEYESGIGYYKKALEYTHLSVDSPYEANIKNQLAWGYMRLGNYDLAMDFLVKDRYNSDITVNSSVTRFIIAYLMKNTALLTDLKPEFSSRNRSLHRMIFSLLDKEHYFDATGNWLVEDSEIDALFEFAQFTHFELEKAFSEIAVRHYIDKQNYQQAFNYADKIKHGYVSISN